MTLIRDGVAPGGGGADARGALIPLLMGGPAGDRAPSFASEPGSSPEHPLALRQRAIGGHTCRLASIWTPTAYWSECAKNSVRPGAGGERSQNGAAHPDARSRWRRVPHVRRGREKLELAQKSAFKPSNDVPKTELGGSVRFTDVWVQHQPERYSTGKALSLFLVLRAHRGRHRSISPRATTCSR